MNAAHYAGLAFVILAFGWLALALSRMAGTGRCICGHAYSLHDDTMRADCRGYVSTNGVLTPCPCATYHHADRTWKQ